MAKLLPNILTFDDKVSAICQVNLAVTPGHDSWVQLTSRDLETSLHSSELHGSSELQTFLTSKPTVVNVRMDCCKK